MHTDVSASYTNTEAGMHGDIGSYFQKLFAHTENYLLHSGAPWPIEKRKLNKKATVFF